MRRVLAWVAAGAACIAAAALLGPRARVSKGVLPPVAAPWQELAAETTPGVTLGAEKGIVWADSAGRRTELALVYLHGFSATRREVHPLVDSLGARLGANVFYTRFKGHGLPGSELGAATADDWLRDTAEALAVGRAIGERLVLVGTSTGATLAALAALAAVAPGEAGAGAPGDAGAPAGSGAPGTADIAAVILISPNFGPADEQAEMLLWPWGAQLARIAAGEWREWTPANEEQARFWTTRYPTSVLPEMMALVDAARRAPLESVLAPVYVVYSDRDQVISARRVEENAARFPHAEIWNVTSGADSARVAELKTGSFHVIAGDILAPGFTRTVADSIEAFVRRAVR